ncbi:MAG: class I SAM-dependent methyltransferase, partial [Pseudobdellovibrionaceae bacterium]
MSQIKGLPFRKVFEGLATVRSWMGWGGRSQGFFIPYPYASTIPVRDESHKIAWIDEKWRKMAPVFEAEIERACQWNERFGQFAVEDPGNVNQPRFNQGWFPGLDGAMAYHMVRTFKPKKILEVGSGHSTRFMAQAIQDGGLKTFLHSIDPVPRREIDSICTQITRKTVDQISVEELCELESGDMFFIDASHILMPGTDVDYLFAEVLPRLRSGVIVHIHDIFLPLNYPNNWRWRGYNENHAVAIMLGGGNRYEVLMPNAFMRKFFSHSIAK